MLRLYNDLAMLGAQGSLLSRIYEVVQEDMGDATYDYVNDMLADAPAILGTNDTPKISPSKHNKER